MAHYDGFIWLYRSKRTTEEDLEERVMWTLGQPPWERRIWSWWLRSSMGRKIRMLQMRTSQVYLVKVLKGQAPKRIWYKLHFIFNLRYMIRLTTFLN